MNYPVTRNTDVAGSILGILLQQFKGKPRIEGIAAAFGLEAQALENALYQLLTEINLDYGVGTQLELIGKLLRVKRRGLSDIAYRLRLRVEILINASAGTIDDLLAIVRAASALVGDASYSLAEESPATVTVYFNGTVTDAFLSELFYFLNRARALGVALLLSYGASDENTFTFASIDSAEVASASKGWSDTSNPTTGGKLRWLVGA